MTAPNRLAQETSPYLRQHKDNPVDWYPWGPEAFAAAEARNVPILLSVGYSACHWCHVMAHECFENEAVAEQMNRLFVNIKVDREERPDVDAVYMDAVQAMTQRGGWPMTVFLTPERQPFYGGTYFPRDNFVALMSAIEAVWRDRRSELDEQVGALMSAIARTSSIAPTSTLPGLAAINAALQQLGQTFDGEWGGFGSPPKFPPTMNLDVVLRSHLRQPSDAARTVIATTLDAMASGGMYDHIGGGFARYSTDQRWLVPHFEKMLYDQALLLRSYVHAWLVFGEPQWKQVVEETVAYVLGEMTHPHGGWFSAEDADSPDEHGHGHEGLFSTWTIAEMREVIEPTLGTEGADAAIEWWEAAADGNFEGRNILCRLAHQGELLRPPVIDQARTLLYEARSRRRRPGLDDKVLTEWNALFLGSLAEAATAFGRADWLAAAIANAEFLLDEMRGADGRWFRSWQAAGDPPARHRALAADHAALVDAFTRLGEASGQARWIAEAVAVADTLLDHFWDTDAGGVFTTADDGEALIVRQKDVLDGATPSANSVTAVALYRLAALTGEMRFGNHADQTMQLLGAIMAKAPTACGHALAAVDMIERGISQIVITGERPDLVDVLRNGWLPNAVVAWGEPYESPLWEQRPDGYAYVCEHFICRLPVTTAEELHTMVQPTRSEKP